MLRRTAIFACKRVWKTDDQLAVKGNQMRSVCVCACVSACAVCAHSHFHEIKSFGFSDHLISQVPLVMITVCPKVSQFSEKRCAKKKK